MLVAIVYVLLMFYFKSKLQFNKEEIRVQHVGLALHIGDLSEWQQEQQQEAQQCAQSTT